MKANRRGRLKAIFGKRAKNRDLDWTIR